MERLNQYVKRHQTVAAAAAAASVAPVLEQAINRKKKARVIGTNLEFIP